MTRYLISFGAHAMNHNPDVELRAAQPGSGIGQGEDSVQRHYRLPHPKTTQVGAEVLGVPGIAANSTVSTSAAPL